MLETLGDSLGRNLNSCTRKRDNEQRRRNRKGDTHNAKKSGHKRRREDYPELNTSVNNNGNETDENGYSRLLNFKTIMFHYYL